MIDQSKAVQQQSATGVLDELALKADDFVRDDDWIERDFVVRVELTQEQFSTLRLALFRDTQFGLSLERWRVPSLYDNEVRPQLLRALDIERSMSRNEGTLYGQLSFMSPWEFGDFLKWAGSHQNLTIWQVVSQCLTALPELTES